VVVLTKHLAATYAKDNIRANAVCPSFIRTAMLDGLDEEVYTYLSQLHPLGRLADPLEVAYCVLFFASDESSYVTGSSLMVDGGYTAV
jgi:NAD(P)-dependent dehydrogenase (short-subunit alcohol dehydrogenase family)